MTGSDQVRVAGAGHSFTDAVLTDGTLLSLERMDRVLDVDRSSGLVRVEAGITLGALSDELWRHGLAFENLGDIDVQSIAGATATGTHGTGSRLPNLSATLHSIELVTADGSVTELERGDRPRRLARRARVGRARSAWSPRSPSRPCRRSRSRATTSAAPLDEVLASIDELADGSDHFEFFTFPYSDRALTRTNRRVPGPPRPRRPRLAYLEDEVIKNGFFGSMCRIGRARPALIPQINRLVARLGGMESTLTDRSYRVFATPRSVRFTEMEYAIPREHAVEAIRAVRELVESRELAVSFPFEVRFVKGDDALLSPAGGRDTCYIASHVFEGMEYEPFMRGVEEIMDGFGGPPPLGQAPLPDRRDAAPALPGVGPLRRRARAARPRGPLRQRVRAARARAHRSPPAARLEPARAALPRPAPRRAGRGPDAGPRGDSAYGSRTNRATERPGAATRCASWSGYFPTRSAAGSAPSSPSVRSPPITAWPQRCTPASRACAVPSRSWTSRSTTTCGRSSSGCGRPAPPCTSRTPRRARSPWRPG